LPILFCFNDIGLSLSQKCVLFEDGADSKICKLSKNIFRVLKSSY